MKQLLLILLIPFGLSGCAMFADEIAQSAETVGGGFKHYCENMPDSERPAYKAAVEKECGCVINLTCPE